MLVKYLSMYTISKQFEFEAAHQLTNVEAPHPCSQLHGHSYLVDIELFTNSNDLLPNQWVKDFRELEPFAELIKSKFDHQFITAELLNDVTGTGELIKQTTSENMAYAFYRWCLNVGWFVSKVTVSETRKSRASFSII